MMSVTKNWHRLVLAYLAGRKTPASPENIRRYLERHEISKSHTAITTVCKESLSDILVCHDHSAYDDDGKVILKRFKYSVKEDLPILHELVATFDFNVVLRREFMRSPIYRAWIPQLVEMFGDLIPRGYTDALYRQNLARLRRGAELGEEVDLRLKIYGGTSSGIPVDFTEKDKTCLAESLEHNWLALKFVIHFIFADDTEGDEVIAQLYSDGTDRHISPSVAEEFGFINAFDLILSQTDVTLETLRRLYSSRDTIPLRSPTINWVEFFDQLDRFNSNYTFLLLPIH
ncbi:MAG: hypothetical protein C5S48_01955 [Candidatus Methanogaster sp.]|nr:MAG: hypothetical protein C5S48_01955 [ANME-2 cluster archaeon]